MISSYTYKEEQEAAGISEKDIQKLIAMLNKAGRFADYLGVEMFSASGTLSIRKRMSTYDRAIVLGHTIYGQWDGGDGGERYENGLWAGE